MLACRDVGLATRALQRLPSPPGNTSWITYLRCHDDIGWTFSDEDAALLGVNGNDHRRFLNEFYRGRFNGSFARGLPFQENPLTGDCRISGTCASLAGLEKALQEEGANEVELAIRRILLIHGMILTVGGIPLIYLGDEVGTLNDYAYRDDPAKFGDSRWVHRPFANWEKIDRRNVLHAPEAEVYGGLQRLIAVRKETEAFSGGAMSVVDADNPHVFGYVRQNDRGRILALANLSEREQRVTANTVRNHGLSYSFRDLISGDIITLGDDLALGSYQLVWLMAV